MIFVLLVTDNYRKYIMDNDIFTEVKAKRFGCQNWVNIGLKIECKRRIGRPKKDV